MPWALPSAPTVRQWIEMRGRDWLEPLFDANWQLLRRAGPVLTPVQIGAGADQSVVIGWSGVPSVGLKSKSRTV